MNESYRAWSYALPVTVTLILLGVVSGRPEFFVAAVIPAVFILFSKISRSPSEEALELERSISDEAPGPGEEVEITVSAKNDGSTTMTDLRIVDGVPEGLKVTDGSPRSSIALSPGKEKQFSYSLVARRGSYVFESAKAEFSSGSNKKGVEVEASGDKEIQVGTEIQEAVLRDKTDLQTGDLVTRDGGSGVEFHSLRDYKSSDPISRIEWRHMAKTGDLATKNFREERSGKIIIVLDARESSDRKADEGHPTGVDLSAYAARTVFKLLDKSRHRTGLAVLGVNPEDVTATSDSPVLQYIRPGSGRRPRQKILGTLEDVQKADKHDEDEMTSRLYRMLPPDSQILFFSPLLDDGLEDTLKLLDTHGFPSTVVSPDVTYADSPAARLEAVERDLRVKELRKWAPVIDWDVKRPMSIQVSKALRRIYMRDKR